MPKTFKLFVLSLIIIIFAAVSILFLNYSENKPSKSEADTAINQAKMLYQDKIKRGEDISTGPCLSNALIPNWVVDIAHSPRQSLDDLAENQCAAFLEGSARHFVELDTNGNLIRAQ